MQLKSIHYQFKDPDLLAEALTHKSYGQPHNERLEFLGDAVLSLVITTKLYQSHPNVKEGNLSTMRAALVKKDTLAQIAKEIQLGDVIRLGKGELASGGMLRPSILANALEALIGGIYLDGGIDAAQNFILKLYQDQLDGGLDIQDSKTQLQEFLQSHKLSRPNYVLTKTTGKAHEQYFFITCEVYLGPENITKTFGEAHSRKQAEQQAAEKMFSILKKEVGR